MTKKSGPKKKTAARAPRRLPRIEKFDLEPGRTLGGTYRVENYLGGGYEGEVYRISEIRTGVPRTAKLFFPHRNEKDKQAREFARKLERLRDCSMVIQYHHAETIQFQRQKITCLISEYVEGVRLSSYIKSHPGGRIAPYKALNIIYALARGVDQIHWKREYHGDLHTDNILIRPRGILFDIKLVDFYNLGRWSKERRAVDIIEMVQVLYEMIGGKKWYAKMPQEIKDVCRGLRHDLILRSFPTTRHLIEHLESFETEFYDDPRAR